MPEIAAEKRLFQRMLLRAMLMPVLGMAILVAILGWQITDLRSASRSVERTQQILAQAHNTHKLLVDMETGLRGYLLTGQESFLEPYQKANTAFPPAFADMKQKVAHSAAQTKRLEELYPLSQQWLAETKRKIRLRQQGEDYRRAVLFGTGKRMMDDIRERFALFISEEEAQQRARTQYAESRFQLTFLTLLLLGTLAGLGLAYTSHQRLTTLSQTYAHSLETARTHAQALQTSEQRLDTTLQSIGDGVIAADDRGNVTFLNPVAERLTGWTQEEAQGKKLTEVFAIINEESHERVETPVEKVLREGDTVGLANHTLLLHRDGSETPIDDSVAPIRDAAGRISGVVLVFHDITARKKAEEAIRQLADFQEKVLDSAIMAIGALDTEGRFTLANPCLGGILGYAPEELIGQPFHLLLPPEDLPRVQEFFDRTMREGTPLDRAETQVLRKDGKRATVRFGWAPLTARGKVIGLVGIGEDITERKYLENQLLQAQRLESIGRLAGGIAHDFNNILTAIIGYSELAQTECSPGTSLHSYLQNVLKATERASNLTRQLLTFARRQTVTPQVNHINTLLLGLDSLMRRLIGENIELVFLLKEGLNPVKVDAGQFEQIVVNLIVNARDAMPQGGKITLETANVMLDAEYSRHHPEVTPGDYILLAISDTGSGIDEAVQLHIFEPFYTTKAKGRGTGLGLATVYGIVKQAGGHIWLYSEPGEGATFKIYLPRTTEALPEVNTAIQPADLPGGSETILLVEDEPSVRALAVQTLRARGYRVLEASHGGEALQTALAHSGEIALLVTDVVMPQMSGKQLADSLLAQFPGLRVLYTSGYTENTIVHHGVLDSGVDFLAKPFTPSTLANRVRQALDGK